MTTMDALAWKFGKHDMERLGIFTEMPYMNGKGYVSPFPKPVMYKGRNIMCEGHKSKNGTQQGYFDDTFRRLFEGEAISRPAGRKSEGDDQPKKKSKSLPNKPFIPPGIPKWHACPGDYYGTFSGIIEAFGVDNEPKSPHKKEKANPLTNPSKKGGPGYTNICLSKYPEHMVDPYGIKAVYKQYGVNLGRAIVTVHYPKPYFDPNPYHEEKPGPCYVEPVVKKKPEEPMKWIPPSPAKKKGGCGAGMFSEFPQYKSNRDPKKEKKMKLEREKARKLLEEDKGKFLPQSMGLKTMLTTSVLNHNTSMRVNAKNYKVYEPTYTKHLLSRQDY